MPTLAAAGIVVTEIRTPMSAPDLAVLRESVPATPAQTATTPSGMPATVTARRRPTAARGSAGEVAAAAAAGGRSAIGP